METKFSRALFMGSAVMAATALFAPAALAQPQVRPFRIAPQALAPALRAFSLQSGADIVFDPQLVRGKDAPALDGRFADDDALRRLLVGSGLTFERTANGAFVIRVAAAAAASARQTAHDTADIGTVVVIARRSIDTPRAQIKRTSPGVSDSVTVSDVENTPDTTLPEALDRIAGVSADKYYGTSDGGYVSIRAFDSRYNSMDIDGNPIWFSSQNNRGAQIGVFPSSIIKETTVYKTVTPDQDGNSVGGHISLRTLRAFDGGDRPYLSLGGRIGGFDQESVTASGPSSRLYGAGKFTFGADHQFGVVLGFNAQQMRSADKYGGVDTYAQVNGQDEVNANLYSNSIYDKDVKNAVGYAKIEMRKNDGLYAFLSGTLIDDARRQYLDREGTYIYQTTGRTTNFADGAADFNKAIGYTKEYDYDIQRKAKIVGAGVDYQVNPKGLLTVRANYTDFTNTVVTRYPETFTLSNLSGHYDLGGDLPTVTLSDPATYDNAANWTNRNTTASYVRDQILRDKVTAIRADFNQNTYADARGLGFATGLNWNRLDRGFDQNQDNYLLPKGTVLRLSDVAGAGATMANNDAIKMNWDAFWNYVYANGIKTTDLAPATDYHLVENVYAAHAEAYFTGERFRLIAGVRYEETHDGDTTGDTVNGVNGPSQRANTYGNWMPNVQGSYDLTSRLKLRLAFTKTIGRPDFSDFAPGRTVGVDSNGNPVISGSNPKLGPRLSTNYDASLEYYLHDGVLSLAVFHKDLDHETFSEKTVTLDAAGGIVSTQTMPLNSGTARVTGVELTAAKRHLDVLPAPFNRLGVSANYTYLDSEWTVVLSDGMIRTINSLRNQPKYMGNLDLSYDLGPVDLHLDYRVRGRAFTTTFGTTPAGDQWIRANDQLDLQANWRVAKGLQLTAEARNLTDSYTVLTTGATNAVYNSVGAGRSYFFGFKYHY